MRWQGAVGDLGTFLPHIIGAITVAGMAPTGIFTSFGLFYLLAGAFYGVPIGVQPMKAASAVLLIVPMTPPQVAGAGLVLGIAFFLAGVSGVITRLARVVPPEVAGGIQLGLGISLAGLGLRLLQEQLWLGLVVSLVTLLLLGNRRLPAALAALADRDRPGADHRHGGAVATAHAGAASAGLRLAKREDIIQGTQLAVIPQIPLR